MLKFNPEEQGAIMRYYRQLQKQLEGNEINAENVAMELLGMFPNMEYGKLLFDCQQMAAGVQRFMDAYGDPSCDEPADAKRVLDKITAGMNEQQRKGFCLNVYDSLREYDSHNYMEAAESQQASELVQNVDEEELRDLVAEQVSLKGEELAGDSAENDMPNEDLQETAPEPMLYAAAIYTASLSGAIPGHFAKSPEMTGACAAATSTLARQINENPEKAKDKSWVGTVIAGICVAAVLVGLAIMAAPTVVTTVQQLLIALSTGNVTVWVKNFLRPVLKTAKIWAPAMLVNAKDAVAQTAREVGKKFRSFYNSVKSKLGIGKTVAQKLEEAQKNREKPEEERPEEENPEDEKDEEKARSGN